MHTHSGILSKIDQHLIYPAKVDVLPDVAFGAQAVFS